MFAAKFSCSDQIYLFPFDYFRIKFFAIFLNGVFRVVIYRNRYDVVAGWFISWVVKLCQIWMAQSLHSCKSFFRIKLKKIVHQVCGLITSGRQQLIAWFKSRLVRR